MSVAISFRDAGHHQFPEGLSCDIETGCSALIVTSREDESTALTDLVTGMTTPVRGSVLIDGRDFAGLDSDQIRRLRREIAVVPSHGGMISNLKLWENITLPLMYHSGGISPEEERTALDLLERMGYTGGIMAMPAHLTIWQKRSAALVRALLCRPKIILYSNFIDDAPPDLRRIFCQIAGEFHSVEQGRTSVYLSSSPDPAAELPVDLVVRLHDSGSTVSRHI